MDVLRALLPRVTLKQALIVGGAGGVLGGGALSVVVVLIVLGAMGGTVTGPPDQPIAFDHTVHAGDAGIACEFCHRGVTTQASATVPAVEQCMFCHAVVATDRPEIQLLQAHWETNMPVNWTRVHRLPDHVDFTHAPHIQIGIECSTCHGDVASMEQVQQVRSLNMGDCQNCHRQGVERTVDGRTETVAGPLDCAACHK